MTLGTPRCRHLFVAVALILLSATVVAAQSSSRRTRNVVLIITDGLRWQEVFGGAERALIGRAGGVGDTASLLREFWRETPEARREALLPFLWGVVARQGQIFGNPAKGSTATVTNGLKFSYPGYNELLTGAADPRINSNSYGPNPNTTVFEWLGQRHAYRQRVAAVATWDAFDRIFNRERSGVDIVAGWKPPFASPSNERQRVINDLYRTTTRLWSDNAFDALMHQVALEYVRTRKPRVLFLGYGETDEWAHAGRYDLTLQSARQVDAFIRELWERMQRMPEYRDATTFVITTDHGRGSGPDAWKQHGEKVEGAEFVWMAVLGPDTPALGELSSVGPVTQSQVAATIAHLLGEDFGKAMPSAARPLPGVVRLGAR